MRLIDADKLKEILPNRLTAKDIDAEPTAYVVKHSYWEWEPEHVSVKCILCSGLVYDKAHNAMSYEYCPYCGARMDKKEVSDEENNGRNS